MWKAAMWRPSGAGNGPHAVTGRAGAPANPRADRTSVALLPPPPLLPLLLLLPGARMSSSMRVTQPAGVRPPDESTRAA
jgi:hypothetical protein